MESVKTLAISNLVDLLVRLHSRPNDHALHDRIHDYLSDHGWLRGNCCKKGEN